MVLAHSLDYFCVHPQIAVVILVLPEGKESQIKCLNAAVGTQVVLAKGGATRQDSVRAGLDALEALPNCDKINYVAIHDAARPLIPSSHASHAVWQTKVPPFHQQTASSEPKKGRRRAHTDMLGMLSREDSARIDGG